MFGIVVSTVVFVFILKFKRLEIILGLLSAVIGAVVYYVTVIVDGGKLDGFTALGIYVTFLICLHINALLQSALIWYMKEPGKVKVGVWLCLLVPLDLYTWAILSD